MSIREITSALRTSWNTAAACIEPLYNIAVAPREVILTVDLPYADERRVKVRCLPDDVLEIHAETSRKISFKDLGVKHRAGEFTYFHASIPLPLHIDKRRVTKRFKRGVLEIRLPRLK